MKRHFFRLFFCLLVSLMLIVPASRAQSPQEEWNKALQLFNEGQRQFNISDFRGGAIQRWEAALSIFQKFGQEQAISAVVGNLGLAYSNLGNYRKAINYLEKALAIAEEIGDKEGTGIHLSNLGITYRNLGDYRKAKDYSEKAADVRTASLRSVTIVAKQTQDITGSQATKESGYTFSRLPNTGKEVREVGRLFSKNKLLVGPDASEEKVKAEDLSSMRYVLFSTHGILGNEIPYIKQPALVLNLLGNDKEDGFLTAGEIFGMNLNADIVGLSACKTGLGIQSAGEGVTGLSRAFMYAGSDSVLVSLWSVADESTYKLMVKFFEGLKAGKDKMTALKDAKDYLRRSGYANPFYWAPFIIMGEVD